MLEFLSGEFDVEINKPNTGNRPTTNVKKLWNNNVGNDIILIRVLQWSLRVETIQQRQKQ